MRHYSPQKYENCQNVARTLPTPAKTAVHNWRWKIGPLIGTLQIADVNTIMDDANQVNVTHFEEKL